MDSPYIAEEHNMLRDQLRRFVQEFVEPDGQDWEELIHEVESDVLVVGRGGDETLLPERMRRLLQVGAELIVSHPIADMLLGFELQMIRQDTDAVVLPFFVGAYHPVWDELKRWVDEPEHSPVGRIEQFEWERSLESRDRRVVQLPADVLADQSPKKT